MRKSLIAFALFALVLAAQAVDTPLFSFVPDRAELVVGFDVPVILRHPEIAKRLSDPEVAEEIALLEKKSGLRLADFGTLLLVAGDKIPSGGFFESGKIDIASRLASAQIKFTKREIGGKNVCIFAHPQDEEKSAALCQAAPGVIGFSEGDDAKKFFGASAGHIAKLRTLAAGIPGKPLVWCAAAFQQKDEQGKKYDLCLWASVELKGAEQADWHATAELVCPDAQTAKQFKKLVPIYANMVTAIFFSQNPELGAEVTRCLKCSLRGTTLKLSLVIPKALAQKISDYSAMQAKQALTQQEEDSVSQDE